MESKVLHTDGVSGIEDAKSVYFDVNGVRLHAIRAGEGSTLIVFLHGFPEFWYSWRHQIKEFSRDFTVIAPDMRGYNLSDKPASKSAYHAVTVATDISELISAAGFNNAVVVGHDWGGAIAWKLAAVFPDKVSSLVILNCPHPAVFGKHLKKNVRQMLRSWYMLFFQLPYLPEMLIKFDLKRFFTRTFKDWSFNKNAFSEEDIKLYVEAFRKKGALTSALNYYRASLVRAGKFFLRESKVQVPTLMIWGENDKALGKELTGGTEKYISAPFRLEFIANCSHWVQNEYPEQVNRLIRDFIRHER